VKILLVADEHPWPARTGYRQRLDHVVRTLCEKHEVVVISAGLDERTAMTTPHDVALARHIPVVAPARHDRSWVRLGRWLTSSEPRALLWRDWSFLRAAVDEQVREWAPDLLWCSHGETFDTCASSTDVPLIVDLDNVMSWLLRHRRRSAWARATRRTLLRDIADAVSDSVDIPRWRRLESRVSARASFVLVCSETDRQRVGGAGVEVLVNTYPEPSQGALRGREQLSVASPNLLMVGLMSYTPNQDAAAFVATEVLPRLRSRGVDATFRVVGPYGRPGDVESFKSLPGVVVTGGVDSVHEELARADVALVPIRFGGGTRIKILEAFAYRLPVVSTTIGAEGLAVERGRHLLIADTAEEMAEACTRVLADPTLRMRLVYEAHALWRRAYRPDVTRPLILDLVRTAVDAECMRTQGDGQGGPGA
jgi:glycosyltransferase involved in cell wall biosynthesis